MPEQPNFVIERRGGFDEWSEARDVLVDIELPDGRLSPFGKVTVRRDGEEFTAQLEAVDSFGDPTGRCVAVESWVPEFEEVLSESEFQAAWGEWLFPAD